MQRDFKFKAWDKKQHLLVRLNTIECTKGELHKKDHILLQFTGLLDKNEAEVYENDIILLGTSKYLVVWDDNGLCWAKVAEKEDNKLKIYKEEISKCVKLCNYYESPQSFITK